MQTHEEDNTKLTSTKLRARKKFIRWSLLRTVPNEITFFLTRKYSVAAGMKYNL